MNGDHDTQAGDRKWALMNQVNVQASAYLMRCTVPFIGSQKGRFGVAGSGVLLEIGDMAFALTASHVFEKVRDVMKAGSPIDIPTGIPGRAFIRLEQAEGYYSMNPKGSGFPEDPLDVAFFVLSPQIADRLREDMHFLHLPELDLVDPLSPESQYLVYGYPEVSLDQQDDAQKLFYTPLHLVTRVYRGGRGDLPKYREEFSLNVDYVQQGSMDARRLPANLPRPHGISGCGIWHLARSDSDLVRWSPSMLKLVGIEHTWNRQVQVLSGTRIGHIIAEIAHMYENLRPSMKVSYVEDHRQPR